MLGKAVSSTFLKEGVFKTATLHQFSDIRLSSQKDFKNMSKMLSVGKVWSFTILL